MSTFFKTRFDCRVCGSSDLSKVLHLNPLPLYTPNVGSPINKNTSSILVPLELCLCGACQHLQLSCVTDPDTLYGSFRYKTSISAGLSDHFRDYAKVILSKYLPILDPLVIEIGSNDGTLLKAFLEEGAIVLGIDPATEIAEKASASGIETIPDFFTARCAELVIEDRGQADAILCNNTLANIDDLSEVFQGIDTLLKPEGVLVIETSYGGSVVEKMLLDTIYHEHLSYFSVRSLIILLERFGFVAEDVQIVESKGGSIRVIARREQHLDKTSHFDCSLLFQREALALSDEMFDIFERYITEAQVNLKERFLVPGTQEGVIGAYGASVGSVTLLHQLLGEIPVEFAVDDNPVTNTLLGPQGKITVKDPQILYEQINVDAIVILAPRYADMIVAKHKEFLERGGVFITPFPEVKNLDYVENDV